MAILLPAVILLIGVLCTPLYSRPNFQPCPDKRDPGCCLQKTTFDYKGESVTIPLDYDPIKNQCAWPKLWLQAHNLTDPSETAPLEPTLTAVAQSSAVVIVVPSITAVTTSITPESSNKPAGQASDTQILPSNTAGASKSSTPTPAAEKVINLISRINETTTTDDGKVDNGEVNEFWGSLVPGSGVSGNLLASAVEAFSVTTILPFLFLFMIILA